MISIQDLIRLKTDKLDKSKVKLVRHKDTRTRLCACGGFIEKN